MLPWIIPALRNAIPFSFIRPKVGDNALMTIKDGNYIVDSINNQFPFNYVSVFLTQSGVNTPTVEKFVTYSNNSDGCPGAGCKCNSIKDHTFCSTACCVQAAYSAVGTYTVTIPGAAGLKIGMTSSGLDELANRVVMKRLADASGDAVISIRTYVGTNLTDGLLDETFFEFKIGTFTPFSGNS